MRVENLKEIMDAPQCGHVLAYFRQGIVFEAYEDLDLLIERIEQREQTSDELLELHLFNEEKEYRSIATRSKRFPAGVIEHIADFKDDTELQVFKEEVSLEKEKGKLNILNHICYQEDNGMAVVEDYRLTI